MGSSTVPEDARLPVSFPLGLIVGRQGSKESIHQICSQTKSTLASALGGRPDVAQRYIDFVDHTMDTTPLDKESFRKCLRALRKVCGHTGLLPSPYVLSTGVEKPPGLASAQGGHANVFRGTYNGAAIAIKELRTVLNDDEQAVKKKICKEVVIWKRLSFMHGNILPFLGVTSTYPPCMISQWMEHGHMTEYICSHPSTNRPQLLMEICEGLRFLHSFEIVHGDLKGPNILIDGHGHVRLADFGVTSVISHLNSLNPSSIGSRPHGTYRWMSPELLDPESADPAHKTPSSKSDIYALAMVVIELFTGKVPFPEVAEPALIFRILSGRRPPRPEGTRILGLSDTIWEMVEKCWQADRNKRPTIFEVLQRLQGTMHA